jgi:hypothetical protein
VTIGCIETDFVVDYIAYEVSQDIVKPKIFPMPSSKFLEDSEKYPMLNRITITDQEIASGVANLLKFFNWTNIMRYKSNFPENQRLDALFMDFAVDHGITILNGEENRVIPIRTTMTEQEIDEWSAVMADEIASTDGRIIWMSTLEWRL